MVRVYNRPLLHVEVLDTLHARWHKAPPMPFNGYLISSVTIGEHLYLQLKMRGVITRSKSLLKVSLPRLISDTLCGRYRDTRIWEKLPDVPFYFSSLFKVGNMLLAAGGSPLGSAGLIANVARIRSFKTVSDIFVFNHVTYEWIKVGNLPVKGDNWSCVSYSSGKLLLINGLDSSVYTGIISSVRL